MAASVALNVAEFRKCMTLKGVATDTEAAVLIGVDAATLSRVLNGHAAPGQRFIGSLLAALPMVPFEDLFVVVPDDEAA